MAAITAPTAAKTAAAPHRVRIQCHKTRSVFERYNIVSEGDLRDAARRLDAQGR